MPRLNRLEVLLQVAALSELQIRLDQQRNRAEVSFQRVDLGEIRAWDPRAHLTTARGSDRAQGFLICRGPRLLLLCAGCIVGGDRALHIRSKQWSGLVEWSQHEDLPGITHPELSGITSRGSSAIEFLSERQDSSPGVILRDAGDGIFGPVGRPDGSSEHCYHH